jgi:hypothetical protein
MSATTYFGDVVTTGNTNIVQNFISYGASSRFTSNIRGNQNIGTSGTPFGNVFASSSNTVTTNTSTIQAYTILSGNVVASNYYQGGNLFTTSMNASGISNTFSLGVMTPNVGIGTTGGASLMVQGNVYISNITTTNVSVGLLNVYGTMNTQTLVTSEMDSVIHRPTTPFTTLSYATCDRFGEAVAISLDGSTLLTCGTVDTNYPTAFVYKFVNGNWSAPTTFMPGSGSSRTAFGHAVAVSADGSVLLIGDPDGYATGPTYRGNVQRWIYSGSAWVMDQNFVGDVGERAGWSVAISNDGNTIVYGSPFYNGNYGRVVAWKRGIGSSVLTTGLDTPYRYGWSVSLSGDGNRLVIGNSPPFAQPYYPYCWLENWNQSTQTWVSDNALDYIGYSLTPLIVSISNDGKTLAVGSPLSYGGGVDIWKYTTDGYYDWVYDSSLVGGDNAGFGSALALSSDGNKLIVGAPDASPDNKGYVMQYTYLGVDSWSSREIVYPSSAPINNHYGTSVAISGDGTLTVIGTQQGNAISFYVGTTVYLSGGASMDIIGAAWVSNTILSTNVYITNLNAATLNTMTLSTTVIDVGINRSASTFEVLGNIYASNALTTSNIFANIYSTRANFQSMNTTNVVVMGTANISPTFNVTTINVNSISNLVLNITNNLYVSNTLSCGNLTVTNTIYYNEDLKKRSLYLQPNSTNAPIIQSAISATCNASLKSYWCTSSAPLYANITPGSSSSNAYSGGVLVPDGRVVFVTSNCLNVSIFNPTNSSFNRITGAPPGFNGGVLLPNGNVLFVPQVSNVCQFNPLTSAFSNIGSVSGSFNGVLGPDGVWFTPQNYQFYTTPYITLYNYTTGQSYTRIQTEQVYLTISLSPTTINSAVSVAWSSSLSLFVSITSIGDSYYSSDGKSWALSGGVKLSTVDSECRWTAVSWNNDVFTAIGAYGVYNSAWSRDGLNWAISELGFTITSLKDISPLVKWNSIASLPVVVPYIPWSVAVGEYFSFPYNRNIARSVDGRTWQPANSIGSYDWKSVTTTSSDPYHVYAVSSYGAAASLDGVDWTPWPLLDTPISSIGYNWKSITNGVIQSGTVLVAVGEGGGIRSAYMELSVDYNWKAPSPSLYDVDSGCLWQSVTWGQEIGCFLAVGSGGQINSAYSFNGKSWYPLTNPSLYSLEAAVWHGSAWSASCGLYAVVGEGTMVNAAYAYPKPPPNNGSILVPSGNVLFSPAGSANVMEYQPSPGNFSNIIIGTDKFNGLVLAPNGNVITVPSGSNICVIDLVGRTSTNVGPITGSASNFFNGGALLPSGNIVFAPGTSGNVGMFDPVALTYSNSVSTGTSGIAFSGATLIPSGQVVFTPSDSANVGILDTSTSVSPEFCLSPYFNKF